MPHPGWPQGICSAGPALLCPPAPCTISFSDVQPADYFYTPVHYLACHGVISGYADGTFRPYADTTARQMVKIVVLGFGTADRHAAGRAATPSPMCRPAFPFFAVIETAAAHGIVSGYACGGPGEPCDSAAPALLPPLRQRDARAACQDRW